MRRGLLLVDKPGGLTSHDVVARLRRAAGLKRVGHTGTLDPLATGLMAVLFGPATRLEPYLTKMDKEYLATVRLGLATATDDVTGEPLAEYSGPWPETGAVAAALRALTGQTEQVPPAFSAIKVAGRPAYRAARAGTPLTLAPRRVTARELRLVNYSPPFAEICATVSSGYYVRALARDLGRLLQVGGGALSALRRTRVGAWRVADAATLDEILAWGPWPEDRPGGPWAEQVLSPARALPHLPELRLAGEAARRFSQGRRLTAGEDFAWAAGGAEPSGGLYKIVTPEGELLGLGELASLGGVTPPGPFLRPRRVLA